MNSLKLTIDKDKAGHRVILGGSMIEGTDDVLEPLVGEIGVRCCFDFHNLHSANSSGIADWIQFFGRFAADRIVTFCNCPPFIVSVMNMIPTFYSKALIESVYIPFTNTECNCEQNMLITREQALNLDLDGEISFNCPKTDCDRVVEPAIVLGDFLMFWDLG